MAQALMVLLSVLQATLPIAVCFPHCDEPPAVIVNGEHSQDDCHPSHEEHSSCCTDLSQDLAPPGIAPVLVAPDAPAPSPLLPAARPGHGGGARPLPGPMPRALLELATCRILR